MARLIYCAKYCLIISVIGVVYLFGLGISLLSGYQYIDIKDTTSSGATCMYSGLIYIFLGAVCIFIIKKKPRIHLNPPSLSMDSKNSWPEI